MTSVDITGWHHERVAGFVEAIKGDYPSVEIEFVLRHHDTDREGQLSLSLSNDEPTDELVARQCQQCQTVTVSKVLPLASLKGPKALSAAEETDDEPKLTDGSRNGDGPP
jgi:uncharacterized protein VirK/YbjX